MLLEPPRAIVRSPFRPAGLTGHPLPRATNPVPEDEPPPEDMARKVTTTKPTRASRRGRPRAKGAAEQGRGRLWRWRRPLFLLGLLFVLAIAGVAYLFTQVPLPAAEPPLLQTTFICGGDVTTGCSADNSIAQLSGGEDRVTVTYDQLPPVLIHAVVSAEDRDFFQHSGVDPVGIARALWANVRNESVQQGGSTITQQYVKNVYLTQERTFTRKIKEAAFAVKVERELSKDEILTRYLNVIYFGRGAYGVQAASRAYFGKNVEDLDLPQAAYLAGLIRSPETADAQLLFFDPKQPEQRAKAERAPPVGARRHVVGGLHHARRARCGRQRVLGQRAGATAHRRQLGDVAHAGARYGVLRRLCEALVGDVGRVHEPSSTAAGSACTRRSTSTCRRAAVDAITSTLNRPDDPSRGAGRARRAGSGQSDGRRDSTTTKSRVNLAVGTEGGGSGRQPGSSFKPIVLAEALKQGIPLDKVYDAPGEEGASRRPTGVTTGRSATTPTPASAS